MKVFSSKKRVAAIGGLTAFTLVGGGVAVAYWTTTGTGTGSASTAAGDGLVTVTQLTTLTAMYPGDAEQPLNARVTNPIANVNNAYVTSLGAYITTDKIGCDGTDFLINGSNAGTDLAPTGLNWTAADLASGSFQNSTGNTVQFNNKAVAQDACKSATVTIHYVAK